MSQRDLSGRAIEQRGKPTSVVMGIGPEFAGRAVDAWAYRRGIRLDFTRPGKPIENCFVESFNGEFRDECLNLHRFVALHDGRCEIENWRRGYNWVRPHRALGNVPSEEYAALQELQPPLGVVRAVVARDRESSVTHRRVSRSADGPTMTELPPETRTDDFEQEPAAIVDAQDDSDLGDRLLSGLGKPIRTGWALWGRSLRPLIGQVLPVVAIMAIVSAAMLPYLKKPAPDEAIFDGTSAGEHAGPAELDAQADEAAAEGAPVAPEYPFEDYPPWPLAVALAVLLIYGLALTGVILASRHSNRIVDNPYLWTAKRLLPWVGAYALTFGVPIGVFLLGGILIGIMGTAGPLGALVGLAVVLAAFVLAVVVSLRLFWADEFALMHGANPVEAVKESWDLTRKGARQIFTFQFVLGLLAYPVFMIAFVIFGILGIPLRVLGAFGPDLLAALVWLMIAYALVFLGYGILHASELVYFYGIRAARQILDPKELATPNWIETAKKQAIEPS